MSYGFLLDLYMVSLRVQVHLRESEVDKVDRSVVCIVADTDVFGFQVSVDVAKLVEITEPLQQLEADLQSRCVTQCALVN